MFLIIKIFLVNDEDEIVYFDLGLKEVLGIYPFPIDDIFKIKINTFIKIVFIYIYQMVGFMLFHLIKTD